MSAGTPRHSSVGDRKKGMPRKDESFTFQALHTFKSSVWSPSGLANFARARLAFSRILWGIKKMFSTESIDKMLEDHHTDKKVTH
jgi:hypothetical protein